MVDESTSLIIPNKRDALKNAKSRSSYMSSRFGAPSDGVRPNRKSINSIPVELEKWHNRSLSNQADSASSMLRRRADGTSKNHRSSRSASTLNAMQDGPGLTKRGSRASFIENIDGINEFFCISYVVCRGH